MADLQPTFIEQIQESIPTIWKRIRRKRSIRFIAFVIAGVSALSVWLAYPVWNHPYVRIDNGAFYIALDCQPQKMEIELLSSNVKVTSVDVMPTQVAGAMPIELGTRFNSVPKESGTLVYIEFLDQRESAKNATNSMPVKSQFSVSPRLSGLPVFDIQRISLKSDAPDPRFCIDTVLEGKALEERLFASSKRQMKYFLIQEKLGDWIAAFNESFGSIILAAMVLSVLHIGTVLSSAIWGVYASSDKTLWSRIVDRCKRSGVDIANGSAVISMIQDDFRISNRRLSFARAIGPAIGFSLTVSSLVAGLHPSGQEAQSAYRLLSSLQIAMVATLIGLLIRVLADFAIRFQRRLSEYEMAITESDEHFDVRSNEPSSRAKE